MRRFPKLESCNMTQSFFTSLTFFATEPLGIYDPIGKVRQMLSRPDFPPVTILGVSYSAIAALRRYNSHTHILQKLYWRKLDTPMKTRNGIALHYSITLIPHSKEQQCNTSLSTVIQ